MVIQCPSCGFRGRIPEASGRRDRKTIICPRCSHRFSVGWAVLPPEGETSSPGRPEVSSPVPGSGSDARGGIPAETPGDPHGGRKPKKKRRFLWGCLATVGAVAIVAAILILGYNISHRVQESKEYDKIQQLGKKYPGYLLLYAIKTDAGSMTETQLKSYQEGLIGKGCVGMGRIVNIEKTTGSAILDLFGLKAPGTMITLTYKEYDIVLVLKGSYTDEFQTYDIGDTVLFAGIIKRATVAKRTSMTLSDVVIEGHTK
jgi:predicted Zn finger-like uncharacterized protein